MCCCGVGCAVRERQNKRLNLILKVLLVKFGVVYSDFFFSPKILYNNYTFTNT